MTPGSIEQPWTENQNGKKNNCIDISSDKQTKWKDLKIDTKGKHLEWNWISSKSVPSRCRVDTVVWMHYMDAN